MDAAGTTEAPQAPTLLLVWTELGRGARCEEFDGEEEVKEAALRLKALGARNIRLFRGTVVPVVVGVDV